MNRIAVVVAHGLVVLALSAALAVPAPTRADGKPSCPSLVGLWQRTRPNDDGTTPFLSFKTGGVVVVGTMVDDDGAKVLGKFAYRLEDGVLSINEGGDAVEYAFHWTDGDHFRLTEKGRPPTAWARVGAAPTPAAPPPQEKNDRETSPLSLHWIGARTTTGMDRAPASHARWGGQPANPGGAAGRRDCEETRNPMVSIGSSTTCGTFPLENC